MELGDEAKRRTRRDARLARAIVRTGSRAKADRLVRLYYDEVLRFVARQVPSDADALDVTQDVFVAALRGLPGFDARRASFRTWLYRIASNKVIDWLRASRPASAVVSLDECAFDVVDTRDEVGELIEAADDEARAARAEELLRACPDGVQRVVRLRVYGGHSFPQIARMLGEPEAAVKARYYRAVRGIRARVEQEERLREVGE